jgi:hypothetical protein
MGKDKKTAASSSSSSSSSSYSKDDIIDIDPDCIRFTHARIRPYFTGCGRKVEDTLSDIIGGKMSVYDLPKITVILNKGTYFSLNNRRLYVLKELRSRGLLDGDTIGARVKIPLEREKERYTAGRCSLVAKIMREGAIEKAVDDVVENTDESHEIPLKTNARDKFFDRKIDAENDVQKELMQKKMDKILDSKMDKVNDALMEKKNDASKKKKGCSKRRQDIDDGDFH